MNNLGERLKKTLADKGISQSELAKRIGTSPQSIQYLCSGKAKGTTKATLIAMILGISPDWLLYGKENRNFNPLDILSKETKTAISGNVPLINWVQAGAWSEIATNYHAEQYYPCPEKHSEHTFALTVCGESMSPDFIDGEIIYVDPQVEPKNGSCVVVQQNGNSDATFKQLVLDGSTRYLKALNPHWPEQFIKMLPDAVICGVVIGSYRKRN